jgi:hypothetical protein
MTQPTSPGSHAGAVDAGETLGHPSAGRIVGLGALCALRTVPRESRSQSFSVAEFALLDDGRRILLHQDRGFTLGPVLGGAAERETAEDIAASVRSVVLPDEGDRDDAGEDHSWSWLAQLASDRGLHTSADELRVLPYEMVLTDDVTRWLASG